MCRYARGWAQVRGRASGCLRVRNARYGLQFFKLLVDFSVDAFLTGELFFDVLIVYLSSLQLCLLVDPIRQVGLDLLELFCLDFLEVHIFYVVFVDLFLVFCQLVFDAHAKLVELLVDGIIGDSELCVCVELKLFLLLVH